MIQLALIHSQVLYRESLKTLLESKADGVKVIATAENLRDLIGQAPGPAVDVIVWDIPSHHVMIPGVSILLERFPLAKLLVLVSTGNAVYAGLLKTLGAGAVIPADCGFMELYQAIVKIHQSQVPHPASNHVQEPMMDQPLLEPAELMVLKLLSEGLDLNEIALQLGHHRSKIKDYQRNLFRKLGIRSNKALIEKGRQLPYIKFKDNQR